MPASLPSGIAAEIHMGSWNIPPIFDAIRDAGNVDIDEMYRVFNMGLGMVAVCDNDGADALLEGLDDAVEIGRIVEQQGQERTIFRQG